MCDIDNCVLIRVILLGVGLEPLLGPIVGPERGLSPSSDNVTETNTQLLISHSRGLCVVVVVVSIVAAVYTVTCSLKVDLCTLRSRAQRCQGTCSKSSTVEVLSAICISRHSGYQGRSRYA